MAFYFSLCLSCRVVGSVSARNHVRIVLFSLYLLLLPSKTAPTLVYLHLWTLYRSYRWNLDRVRKQNTNKSFKRFKVGHHNKTRSTKLNWAQWVIEHASWPGWLQLHSRTIALILSKRQGLLSLDLNESSKCLHMVFSVGTVNSDSLSSLTCSQRSYPSYMMEWITPIVHDGVDHTFRPVWVPAWNLSFRNDFTVSENLVLPPLGFCSAQPSPSDFLVPFGEVRSWSAGCSFYSLASSWRESVENLKAHWRRRRS